MKNIVLISASPKINEQSVSKEFLDMAGSRIDDNVFKFKKEFIDVRKTLSTHKSSVAYETLSKADVIIISFPLYFYCLPGILTRFLHDYYRYYTESRNPGSNLSSKVKVYAIVNCGFPEPDINLEAVRVIRSFSQHIDGEFRFGVLIGSGPMMIAAKEAPFMKKTVQKLNEALSSIAEDVKQESVAKLDDIPISLDFPFSRRLFFFFADRSWVTSARKNRLRKKDLYKKPYRLNE